MKRERRITGPDSGFAMMSVAVALLIVMMMATMASGYMSDYLKSRQWQLMAAQTNRFTQAVESYAGRYYASALASATTTRPVTITVQMLKNTGFLPAGFRETNSNGQQLEALLIRNARHEEVLQGLVITSGGQPLPYKALRQISLDISSGLGGYIRDGRTATGAMNSWTVPLAGFGYSGGNGHIAVLLSPETLTGAREDSDRLYRFQVNGRPELNKMHTSIDMGGNNLNSAGVVNGRYGNFDVSVVSNGPVTAGGDIRSTGGWIISRHGRGWMDESHGGGFYMTDNEWIRSLNNKSIYTGGQLKGGSVRSDSDLSAGGVLKLDQTSYAGTWCPQTGAISHDASGGILLCQSGVWVSSGKLSSFEVVSGNNACGRFVNSVAYCPAGKQLISGGYVLSKWSGGNGWNSPDLSMPSPSENAWKIYTGGGVSGGTCMQAISWCARN
ncbi:shufflon system plasmid conjugative transfer pilus tip adhesin PilV [Salmonella enterica]|nr:shufflon system plasmid conjugative transfer pilus tip adhesin PilV [Salmonella enterica subsp. enterica serovar Overschie]EBZ5139099.1 shufflon system plasmid conjugative transfer pilus tip adhesin PilV [Salmonella enterica subsp. enterica serovar Antsalova]ECD5540188.1 shufflon system plasmid conjugative transfer pilus tip adhesin PilV [Salmonella enterica subsp. enterica serovar Kokomlemle]ECJ2060218.1 shufflon system plasmid conjugative transfer pilus tip adhesin PilV [Salmonella enterica